MSTSLHIKPDSKLYSLSQGDGPNLKQCSNLVMATEYLFHQQWRIPPILHVWLYTLFIKSI